MERSEVLKSKLNTVCVNKEQVKAMLKIFEKFGMYYCSVEFCQNKNAHRFLM